MTLEDKQQAREAITRANSILIISRELPTPDTTASVLAFLQFLQKEQKIVQAVIPGFNTTESPKFLTDTEKIKSELSGLRPLRISLDISKIKIEEFTYDIHENNLEITLLPKNGEWTTEDISLADQQDRFDLIIALDVPDINSLGAISQEHSDFLYRIPIINIDISPNNTRWGQINLIDTVAVSTTEILNDLFEKWNENLIDQSLATNLLAGMISKTRSFRTNDVTPRSLLIASKLVARGAQREAIVHGLWRTKDIDTLQIWGRILSRLEHDVEAGLVWSFLDGHDFLETKTKQDSLNELVNELLAYTPEAKVVAILFQNIKDNKIYLILQTQHPQSANDLARIFGATGTQSSALFSLDNILTVDQAREHAISRLRLHLNKKK